MIKTKLTISIILLFLLTQSNAFAQHKFDKKFNKRMHQQSYAIEDGFYNGDFSYHELKKLFRTQENLQRLSKEFIEDGHYGHKERKILKRRMDRFDKMIDRMRYNRKKYDYVQQRNRNRHQIYRRYRHSS